MPADMWLAVLYNNTFHCTKENCEDTRDTASQGQPQEEQDFRETFEERSRLWSEMPESLSAFVQVQLLHYSQKAWLSIELKKLESRPENYLKPVLSKIFSVNHV